MYFQNQSYYSRQQIFALGLLLLGEEVFTFLNIWFDGVASWFPASWADWKDKPVMSSGPEDKTAEMCQYNSNKL